MMDFVFFIRYFALRRAFEFGWPRARPTNSGTGSGWAFVNNDSLVRWRVPIRFAGFYDGFTGLMNDDRVEVTFTPHILEQFLLNCLLLSKASSVHVGGDASR